MRILASGAGAAGGVRQSRLVDHRARAALIPIK